MCGIAGYIGKKEGLPIVFGNLKKLEYRGYDSAGVAYFDFSGDLHLQRAVGKLENLGKLVAEQKSLPLTAAIGHTRWATHGVPSEANAHPHFDCQKEIFLVHNGIIENYQDLKEELIKKGHRFRSETDTETAAHLIEEYGWGRALKKNFGAYALGGIFPKRTPETLYCPLGESAGSWSGKRRLLCRVRPNGARRIGEKSGLPKRWPTRGFVTGGHGHRSGQA